jgi:hypothetical protein
VDTVALGGDEFVVRWRPMCGPTPGIILAARRAALARR